MNTHLTEVYYSLLEKMGNVIFGIFNWNIKINLKTQK